MIGLVNLAVGTFALFCCLASFGITWMVLGALKVPDIPAFFMSMVYSLIPIGIWVTDELRVGRKEERNEHRVTPFLDDDGCSTPAAFSSKPSKKPRPKRAKGNAVQSKRNGGDGKTGGNRGASGGSLLTPVQ